MFEGISVPVIAKHFRFQWEPAQECYVLLYPEGMVKLNDSAGEILSCCGNQVSVDEIVEKLSKKFPDAHTLPEEVREFFEVAYEKQWINFD
ncbi:MAG: pyrroloquinoline quinone biosynthesis peptide chaperone PqqD [Porticoccus sp.]|nr:pyrroloquinoline quinone biosynthesis peptide chaperone PqqD [Porticoccus sp.]MBQ0807550.1 pyrroloquinoline quinone biosynthesis peptide chaperone PqqD [Porticoccus sp.]